MLAVVTTSCNIYTRMWCVFEMYVALQRGFACPNDWEVLAMFLFYVTF